MLLLPTLPWLELSLWPRITVRRKWVYSVPRGKRIQGCNECKVQETALKCGKLHWVMFLQSRGKWGAIMFQKPPFILLRMSLDIIVSPSCSPSSPQHQGEMQRQKAVLRNVLFQQISAHTETWDAHFSSKVLKPPVPLPVFFFLAALQSQFTNPASHPLLLAF